MSYSYTNVIILLFYFNNIILNVYIMLYVLIYFYKISYINEYGMNMEEQKKGEETESHWLSQLEP